MKSPSHRIQDPIYGGSIPLTPRVLNPPEQRPASRTGQKLDPIPQQPRTPRTNPGDHGKVRGDVRSGEPNTARGPTLDHYGRVRGNKAPRSLSQPRGSCIHQMSAVMSGVSHIAGAIREMDWVRLFQALDAIIRYVVPCESFTLYIVEEQGKYLRKVNPHLETFPPEARGRLLDAVAETTMEGNAAVTCCSALLPSRLRFSGEWAMREACAVTPLPGVPTLHDIADGKCAWPPSDWHPEQGLGGPVVKKVHNVVSVPLVFGTNTGDPEDPFADNESNDSNHVGADESVFGIIKLTNRLAGKSHKKKLQIQRLRTGASYLDAKNDHRYQPFGNADVDFLEGIINLVKEIYFAIDPVTFGSRIERSLDFHDYTYDSSRDPINAPTIGKSSTCSGSRMLDQARGNGMFGIIGTIFRKAPGQRRHAPELPDIVLRPEVSITADSVEAMRGAPGWVNKEWTEEDLDNIGAERRSAGQRRIGGISIFATWKLRDDVVVNPYYVVCRFQARLKRVSNTRPGHEAIWRELPSFFCIQQDEKTQTYCTFLTEYLHYGEAYVVSVRAGSADRWSEWSATSSTILFVASPLAPPIERDALRCNFAGPLPNEVEDPYRVRDQHLHISWPAFSSFDTRTPMPVEYQISSWQREDIIGAAAPKQLATLSQFPKNASRRAPVVDSTPDWVSANARVVATVASDAVANQIVECTIDLRTANLQQDADVYFSISARYLSLPGVAEWSPDALTAAKPVRVPVFTPAIPTPIAANALDFKPPEAIAGTSVGRLDAGEDDGALVVNWPFTHPSTFCPQQSQQGVWKRGPFLVSMPPSQFPLPYRVQCRALGRCAECDCSALSWTEWHEVEAYQFVQRRVPDLRSEQRSVAIAANNGTIDLSAAGMHPLVEIDTCTDEPDFLNVNSDPMGLLRGEWALWVSGLDVWRKNSALWPGLVQLRFVSSSSEGRFSDASGVFCTRVTGAVLAPRVQHRVVNCTSGSISGRHISTGENETEDVVHELRHVARISWRLERCSPSFPFLRQFSVRYRELAPGTEESSCSWVDLPPVRTDRAALCDESEKYVDYTWDLEDVPLLRFHTYTFCVRMQTLESSSDWSKPSLLLPLLLPELLPCTLQAKQSKDDLFSREDDVLDAKRDERGFEGEPAAEPGTGAERRNCEESSLRILHQAAQVTDKECEPDLGQVPIKATVHCKDNADVSAWGVMLSWAAFPVTDDNFPTLATLPVEFQVSFFVLSHRPCASLDATDVQKTVGPLKVSEEVVSFDGYRCEAENADLDEQRRHATVCFEGWALPEEAVVERLVPRSRMPPSRCDVRLFVACRCPVTTGPQWSKRAVAIDIVLPRLAPLPLPVPRQVSCQELQERGFPPDLGMEQVDGCRHEAFRGENLWAVIHIPPFPTEHVVTDARQMPAKERSLLRLDLDGVADDPAHYILQYREIESAWGGASACPTEDEPKWRTVPSVKRLTEFKENAIYVISGFEIDGWQSDLASMRWATLRLASGKHHHFGFASSPVLVTRLSAPVAPVLALHWVDSPSLDGVRVKVSTKCSYLTQGYQLRFCFSSNTEVHNKSWACQSMTTISLPRGGTAENIEMTVLAPIHDFVYHSEYRFAIRTYSNVNFSPWSEESDPIRFSLEHRGMVPLVRVEEEDAVIVDLLGQQERHNYRSPAVDVSWPRLSFPKGTWGPHNASPEPDMSIEYRLRWRRRIDAHNTTVARNAVLDEILTEKRTNGLELLCPDPDLDLQDLSGRGYRGEVTKIADPDSGFWPWQVATLLPARSKDTSVTRCACAIFDLREKSEYELAIDWRWRRVGDCFWVPVYENIKFSTLASAMIPPVPRPIIIEPETWDEARELSRLGAAPFAVFRWPFCNQPAVGIVPAGRDRLLRHVLNPLESDYCVQSRPLDGGSPWLTCDAKLLHVNGKPLCVIPTLPNGQSGSGTGRNSMMMKADDPVPSNTPAVFKGKAAGDELEFRIVRAGDCEASPGLSCVVDTPPPPASLDLRLRLLRPHSTLVVTLHTVAAPALGHASAPKRIQIRIQDESDGGPPRLLPPQCLPRERIPEACPSLRTEAGFLGNQKTPTVRSAMGAGFIGASGGGEDVRVLDPLHFEHQISFQDISYGKTYSFSVRWLSQWRVSPWSASVTQEIRLTPPVPEENAEIETKMLHLVELPCSRETGSEFLPPGVAECVQLAWPAFRAELWGGGRMEYEVQRRCMLQERRRANSEDEAYEHGTKHQGRKVNDTTPWETAGVVIGEVEEHTGKGIDRANTGLDELHLVCEDLVLSAKYQFRVRARLCFHPNAGYAEEWSQFIHGSWHTTSRAPQQPQPPVETRAPDPPPPKLLKNGSLLLSFGHLPMRETVRPDGAPPPPSPYELQFCRGDEENPSLWWRVESEPFDDGRFLVSDPRFLDYLDTGVRFRLWRCAWTSAETGSQTPDDDTKVRSFKELASAPSGPIRVSPAQFSTPLSVWLRFGKETQQGKCSVDAVAAAPLVLHLEWAIVPSTNPLIEPICMHQVRYRLAKGVAERDWQHFDGFYHHTSVGDESVSLDLPVASPSFVIGGQYEIAVRIGTNTRWGAWCEPVRFSLVLPPPELPEPSGFSAVEVKLKDETTFFQIKWNPFRPHPLAAMLDYRIRVKRVTQYKYRERLSDEMAERSAESMEAQGKWHVIGQFRKRVPRKEGVRCDAEEATPAMDPLEFTFSVPAQPECGYRFAVDAKHDRCDELQPPEGGELWSAALESEELITPPSVRNWFVPAQVPLEVSPLSSHYSGDYFRIPFPIVFGETSCEECNLTLPDSQALLIYAPWLSSKEASRWPHRLEYSPYIPRANGFRLPLPDDGDEAEVVWFVPKKVEIISEDQNESTDELARVSFALVTGFDEMLWVESMRNLGIHLQDSQALGTYVRLRVVREGGPEGLSLSSSPSPPMLLRMQPVEDSPSVRVWCVNGRFTALIWWPWTAARAAEEDKNLDVSMHAHQIRMRRPLYEQDFGWVGGPIRRTSKPVLLTTAQGQAFLNAFDIVNLLDDSTTAAEGRNSSLPMQPTGPIRDETVLTYEFSVRVSDGFRWSEWSKSSEAVNFAIEPRIIKDTPVTVDELAEVLAPTEATVCPAVCPKFANGMEPLARFVEYSEEGDMEPPTWVSISRPPEHERPAGEVIGLSDAVRDSNLANFVVSWPNLPPQVYCEPEVDEETYETLQESGLLPAHVPPGIVYRLNVWLVGSAPDAAPIADLPDGVQVDGEPGAHQEGAILYKQIDLPPAAFPEIRAAVDENDGQREVASRLLSWTLPTLLPDRQFRCTVEARFQTHCSVDWWTTLMRSNDFCVERVAPPASPEPMPLNALPTPEYNKLLGRTALGSTGLVAVRWPWNVEGRSDESLRQANYVLELSESKRRPTVLDPSDSNLVPSGETPKGRPLGPWAEATSMQLYFVNFKIGAVFHERPSAADDQNLVCVLIASGLPVQEWPACEPAGLLMSDLCEETPFVHARWRYRARPADLAVVPTPLHFSAASAPIRTRVVTPIVAPYWGLECPTRANRIVPTIKWSAWTDSRMHQFSLRLSQPFREVKDKNTMRGLTCQRSESIDGPCDEREKTRLHRGATTAEVLTGWLERPPFAEGVEVDLAHAQHGHAEGDDGGSVMHGVSGAELPAMPAGGLPAAGLPPEEKTLSNFSRRLAPNEWNHLLFRHYLRDTDEFVHEHSNQSQGSVAPSRAVTSPGSDETEVDESNGAATARRGGTPFRMTWGMMVEWRVRVSDGLRWSQWSPPSLARSLLPPIPTPTTEMRAVFTRRDPTNMTVSWGTYQLADEYADLASSIEYLVYLSSDETSARVVLQSGQGTFNMEKLHRQGITMSEGSCGLVLPYTPDGLPHLELDSDDLFSEASAFRIVGKFRQDEAKLMNVSPEDCRLVPGFELAVSGLKPEYVHRVSVRARCSTPGLDEPDWLRGRSDGLHPLRWSDPQHSPPVLTPKAPPPLLVPEVITLPENRFGRFTHTPCLLLKSPIFKKTHQDDFDKVHPIVLDIRPSGGLDEDFRQVPLANSVFVDLDGHGPCRLIHGIPLFDVEVRARNQTMNDVSAPGTRSFTVPPLILGSARGPDVELVLRSDGALFVKVSWVARVVPRQNLKVLQVSLRRHSVEAPSVDIPAQEVVSTNLADMFPTTAVSHLDGWNELVRVRIACDEVSETLVSTETATPLGTRRVCCRRCFRGFSDARVKGQEQIGSLQTGTLEQLPDLERYMNDSVLSPEAALTAPGRQCWSNLVPDSRRANICQCRDALMHSVLPVDGEFIAHCSIYRFKVRVKDNLNWSPWTEFSSPVSVVVPPPKPQSTIEQVLIPAPPPIVEVSLWKGLDAVDAFADLVSGAGTANVQLRLRWPRFEGKMKQVEYRLSMWTLSPKQRDIACQPRDHKSRCTLPPVVGTQLIVLNPDAAPIQIGGEADAKPNFAQEKPKEIASASIKPRVVTSQVDAPQIIAHVVPFAPPSRSKKRLPALETYEEEKHDVKTVCADCDVVTLPRGHAYVFAVEAKHCVGICGSVAEWSHPMYTKCIEFDAVPRQLNLEIDAKVGSVVFKGTTAMKAKPTNEKVTLKAPTVSYTMANVNLPRPVPLGDGADAWPAESAGNAPAGKLSRSPVEHPWPTDEILPERLQPGDEIREA